MGSVYLGWLLIKKVWNQRVANKAGWFLALFPTLILYSCLILREAYVVFFLLIALNGIVDWTRTKNLKSFRFMEDAIDIEVQRQIDLIEDGKKVVQETILIYFLKIN